MNIDQKMKEFREKLHMNFLYSANKMLEEKVKSFLRSALEEQESIHKDYTDALHRRIASLRLSEEEVADIILVGVRGFSAGGIHTPEEMSREIAKAICELQGDKE